jgi:hypothetical protein
MAVEEARSCGFRKVGGLYLCGSGTGMRCDRLPYEIVNCPTCGSGLKFTRGWTWLDWQKYAGEHPDLLGPVEERQTCRDSNTCAICHPVNYPQPYGLLWIGEKYYSPDAFTKEASLMGVSRRLAFAGDTPRIPKLLKLGITWVLLAHKHVIKKGKNEKNEDIWAPAIFHAFKPSRLELLLWDKDATSARLDELDKAGITLIVIPDGDKDHDPNTPIGLPRDDKEELEEKVRFADMRARLGR